MKKIRKKIIILGASPNKERYSNKAIHMALKSGMEPILVNPKYSKIEGLPVFPSLKKGGGADYLSVYLSYPLLEGMIEDIVSFIQFYSQLSVKVILNPGSDSPEALKLLSRHQIAFTQACTLVLFSTAQIP